MWESLRASVLSILAPLSYLLQMCPVLLFYLCLVVYYSLNFILYYTSPTHATHSLFQTTIARIPSLYTHCYPLTSSINMAALSGVPLIDPVVASQLQAAASQPGRRKRFAAWLKKRFSRSSPQTHQILQERTQPSQQLQGNQASQRLVGHYQEASLDSVYLHLRSFR